jgi:hypothetical protein
MSYGMSRASSKVEMYDSVLEPIDEYPTLQDPSRGAGGHPTLPNMDLHALGGQAVAFHAISRYICDGEALEPGTAFISEHYDREEAAKLSIVAGSVSEGITIQMATIIHSPLTGDRLRRAVSRRHPKWRNDCT